MKAKIHPGRGFVEIIMQELRRLAVKKIYISHSESPASFSNRCLESDKLRGICGFLAVKFCKLSGF